MATSLLMILPRGGCAGRLLPDMLNRFKARVAVQ